MNRQLAIDVAEAIDAMIRARLDLHDLSRKEWSSEYEQAMVSNQLDRAETQLRGALACIGGAE
jgi:hypothetical protein